MSTTLSYGGVSLDCCHLDTEIVPAEEAGHSRHVICATGIDLAGATKDRPADGLPLRVAVGGDEFLASERTRVLSFRSAAISGQQGRAVSLRVEAVAPVPA